MSTTGSDFIGTRNIYVCYFSFPIRKVAFNIFKSSSFGFRQSEIHPNESKIIQFSSFNPSFNRFFKTCVNSYEEHQWIDSKVKKKKKIWFNKIVQLFKNLIIHLLKHTQ